MTTSSKTNMNEDLKKEFEEKLNCKGLISCQMNPEEVLEFIQTAMSKAHESGFEEGLEAGMKIDREQFKANFLTQKK